MSFRHSHWPWSSCSDGSRPAGAGWCLPPSWSRLFSPWLSDRTGSACSAYPFETVFSPAQARLIDEWAAPDLGDARFIGLRLALLVAPVLLLLGRRFPDPLIGLLALGWGWLALGSARYLAIAAPFVVASVLPSVEAIRLRVVRRRPATVQSPRVAAVGSAHPRAGVHPCRLGSDFTGIDGCGDCRALSRSCDCGARRTRLHGPDLESLRLGWLHLVPLATARGSVRGCRLPR